MNRSFLKHLVSGSVSILAGLVAVPIWIWLALEFIQMGILHRTIPLELLETVWPENDVRAVAVVGYIHGPVYVWPVVAVAVGVAVYIGIRRLWIRR